LEYSLEIVRWLDSEAPLGWSARKRGTEALTEVLSVGWIVVETKQYIVMSAHRDDMNENDHSPMTIPKLAITKRKKIKS